MSRRYYNKPMGLTGLGTRPPSRYLGIVHKAVEGMPDRCPKCQGRHGLIRRERWILCILCGEDMYVVSEQTVEISRVHQPREGVGHNGKETP